MPLWLRLNQFVGFAAAMVSLFAVTKLLAEELIDKTWRGSRPDPEVTWPDFKAALKSSHVTLWCAASALCAPILLFSVELQQFGYGLRRDEPTVTSSKEARIKHREASLRK